MAKSKKEENKKTPSCAMGGKISSASQKKPEKITKEMKIIDVVSNFPESAEVFTKYGIHCFGCPFSMIETLGQGASAHGIEVEKLVDELNKKIKA